MVNIIAKWQVYNLPFLFFMLYIKKKGVNMENELNLLTKKYWGRFAIIALVNAAIFTTYRLYVHKLHKEEKNKNVNKESTSKDSKKTNDKINIPVKLAEELTKKPNTKETTKVSHLPRKNAKKTQEAKKSSKVKKEDKSLATSQVNNINNATEKRTVGRPRRPVRVAPHIQKEKK